MSTYSLSHIFLILCMNVATYSSQQLPRDSTIIISTLKINKQAQGGWRDCPQTQSLLVGGPGYKTKQWAWSLNSESQGDAKDDENSGDKGTGGHNNLLTENKDFREPKCLYCKHFVLHMKKLAQATQMTCWRLLIAFWQQGWNWRLSRFSCLSLIQPMFAVQAHLKILKIQSNIRHEAPAPRRVTLWPEQRLTFDYQDYQEI